MASLPSRGRQPYGSPDAVLAEAHRIAADIRRRAERDAIAVRREAAEWASSTRREAERYRERVLAELEHARAVAAEDGEDGEPKAVEDGEPKAAAAEEDGAPPTPDAEDEAAVDPAAPPIIDLRPEVVGRPVRLVEGSSPEVGSAPGTPVARPADDVVPGARQAVGEVGQRPAPGGTYVVGRALPPPATSIETKVHDVVRSAVRRTFHRPFP